MNKKKLIIYGKGRFAEYVQYVFNNDSDYEVMAFSIERSLHNSDSLNGLPFIPFEDLENMCPTKSHSLFIAVGQNPIRKRLFKAAKEKGFIMPSYVSKKAHTWPDLELGENCFIGEGSVIQPFVKIGNNSIHFGSRIGHHSVIHDHTLLSGSTIGGNTTIGKCSYLGLNSSVQQNIFVAPKNIIGMNVSIEENTTENAVFTHKGTQKRKLNYDDVTERFLQ